MQTVFCLIKTLMIYMILVINRLINMEMYFFYIPVISEYYTKPEGTNINIDKYNC